MVEVIDPGGERTSVQPAVVTQDVLVQERDRQPLPVRVYSSIRFGVSPAINAIGTLMLLASALLIVAALMLPRLFGREPSSLDLITGERT